MHKHHKQEDTWSDDHEKIKSMLVPLYDYELSGFKTTIGQFRNPETDQRSQYLIMLLEDKKAKSYVCLRLSDLRKILQYFEKRNLGKTPRRLTWLEKLKLNSRWRKKS